MRKKKKEKIRQYIRDIRENRLRGGINSVVLNTELAIIRCICDLVILM